MLDVHDITAQLLRDRMALTAHVYAIVRNYHLAEDIYQETCLKALNQAGAIESPRHLVKWFRVASRNRAIDLLRARGERSQVLSNQTLEALEESWNAREESHRADLIEALNLCIEKLSPRSREVVTLRYFQDRSGKGISELLGIKVRSVYQTIARVQLSLSECVREQPEYSS